MFLRFHLNTIINLTSLFDTVPEHVVLLNPDYPKHVFTKTDLFVRSDLLEKACPFFTKGLLQAKGEEHKWQKSILSRAFTPEKQKVYVEVGNKFSDQLVQVTYSSNLSAFTKFLI